MQKKITKRAVDAFAPGERDQFLWDTETRGFGLKVTPAGNRIYIVQARLNGRPVRYTIGKHGAPWTPDKARGEAVRKLGEIADGVNPNEAKLIARQDMTISELCNIYVTEGCEKKKASTIAVETGLIRRHIKILIGRKRVGILTRGDIERLLTDVANGKTATDEKTGSHGRAIVTGGQGTANRTFDVLASMLTFAVNRGLRLDNPARGIKKYKQVQRERYLSPKELANLGEALSNAESEFHTAQKRATSGRSQRAGKKGERELPSGENLFAIAAIRLLMLTGCRKSEILSLRWEWVDAERACLRLPDSKTGAKVVPLGPPALKLIAELPRIVGNDHVIPSAVGDSHFVGLQKVWKRIRERAGIPDVRIHDLRHSFASFGAARGDSLYIIGKILGHKQSHSTQRYAHLADDPLRAAADAISSHIAAVMSGTEAEVVTLPKRPA